MELKEKLLEKANGGQPQQAVQQSQNVNPFKKAERKKAKLRVGLAGPSGSGKTYSALLIAQGLGGKIALIDTEHGSGELYSSLLNYDVACLEPPFTCEKYIETINIAEQAGYATIIIDSISHAWAGEGGLLDYHDRLTRSSKSGNSYTAWRDVTPKHNALIEAMLQSQCHIIATMRSKQEYVISEDSGKSRVKKVGLAPVQREGMEYEFTIFLELGIEHYAVATKDRTSILDKLPPFIPTAMTGVLLNNWIAGGVDGKVEVKKVEPVMQPQQENKPEQKSNDVLKLNETITSMLERIGKIENQFELKNWFLKHRSEIDALGEMKLEIVSACTKKKNELAEAELLQDILNQQPQSVPNQLHSPQPSKTLAQAKAELKSEIKPQPEQSTQAEVELPSVSALKQEREQLRITIKKGIQILMENNPERWKAICERLNIQPLYDNPEKIEGIVAVNRLQEILNAINWSVDQL